MYRSIPEARIKKLTSNLAFPKSWTPERVKREMARSAALAIAKKLIEFHKIGISWEDDEEVHYLAEIEIIVPPTPARPL